MTKRLGDGTFGEVMLAKKIDTGDRVAIKRCVSEQEVIRIRTLDGAQKHTYGSFAE